MKYLDRPTIIFLYPSFIPERVAKSKLYWNHSLWKGCDTVYLKFPLPLSDTMAEKHLENLTQLLAAFRNPIMIGSYIGAWWIANICNRPNNLKAAVLVEPIADDYFDPLINTTYKYTFMYHKPVLMGSTKVLVCSSDKYSRVSNHYKGISYFLDFGILRPKNYDACLTFIKEWIEVI